MSYSSVAIKIFELCKEFYKQEKFFENNNFNKSPNICYLIELKSIDEIKKKIYYVKLKAYLNNDNISRENFMEIIKNNFIKNKKVKIETNLVPDKFNHSKDLLKALNKKKFYCITNYNFVQKICENTDISKFVMKSILHKDKITIIFNEKDKDELTFINNTTGLIETSLLIENSNSEILKKEPFNIYPFKNDLELLIRLYYNYRFLKEKENTKFELLNDDNSEVIYLINNNWIEKYKSFFEYKDLEDYLLQLNKNDKLYKTNSNFISEEYIDKIISNLPEPYIKKLEKKNNFNTQEKIDKYETDIIRGTFDSNDIEISYSINNQIINSNIYSALNKIIGEGKNAHLKYFELFFIGNKKILLYNKDVYKNNYEIGYINEENIFITEYIIYYTKNYFKLSNFNCFFQYKFNSFCLDKNKECCHISDKDILLKFIIKK